MWSYYKAREITQVSKKEKKLNNFFVYSCHVNNRISLLHIKIIYTNLINNIIIHIITILKTLKS